MSLIAIAGPIEVQHLVTPGSLARAASARAGESLARFLKRQGWRFDLDTIAVVDGKPVLRRDRGWQRFKILPGMVVRFISRPFGGGGNNTMKQIGGLVALIALTVFAPYATGALLGPALAKTFVGTLANALFVAGGMMLYNTLVYPKPGGTGDDDNLYSFNAQGNTARPLDTIPSAFGHLQRDLDYAAIPYKTYQGEDEYFQGLFMLGCGRYQHDALLIEDNEFWTAEAAAADGTGTGQSGTIPGDAPNWINPQGRRPSSPGVLSPFRDIQVEFVEPGQPVTLFPTNVHQSPEVSGLEFDHPFQGGQGEDPKPGGGWSPWFAVCNPGATTDKVHLDIVLPNGFVKNQHETEANYEVEIRPINDAGAPIGGATGYSRRIHAKHTKPHRFTDSFAFGDQARRALRFRRLERPIDGSQGSTNITAAGLRAELPGSTLFPEGSMVALRIKATKQLSDYSSRKIRYRGTRILPVWTASGWQQQATRNPIWAALDIRTNAAVGGRLPLNRVQLDDFIAAAAAADARGDTFDYEYRSEVRVDEAVNTALGAARSKRRWLGHYYSLVRDEWRAVPRMLVTDREIVRGSLSLQTTFRPANGPDGLIYNYIDSETWAKAQIVLPAGTSPQRPSMIEGTGVTTRLHATREATFHWNAQVKRRTAPTFSMALDGHILAEGDHVTLSSSAPQTWGQAYAVAGVTDHVVRLPRPATWPEATMYALIRTRTGEAFGPCRVTRGMSDRHVQFNTDDLAAILAATGVSLADALARAPDAEAPTLALGEAFDFARRMQVTTAEPDGDRMRISGFLDYEDVHAEATIPAPRPPPIVFPAKTLPAVGVVDASLQQVLFETRLIASWLPSPTANRYVAEVSYDGGLTWLKVYDGPVPAFDVVSDNFDLILVVTPYGDRGAGRASNPLAVPAVGRIGLPAGSVTWESQNKELRNALKQLTVKVDAIGTIAERVAAIVSILDRRDWLQDEKRTDELKVATDNLSASITEARRVAIAGDEALAQLITDLDATVGDNTSDIEQLALTRVTAEQAAALVQDSISAVFGGGSANAKMRLVASAGVGGVLASWDIEMSATGANGSFAKTGLRALVWSDAGVMKSKIQFAADRCEFLKNDGSSFAIFDAVNGKILASAILASSLSAISGNIGFITAGKLQSADGLMVIDLDAKAIIFYQSAGVEVARLGWHP